MSDIDPHPAPPTEPSIEPYGRRGTRRRLSAKFFIRSAITVMLATLVVFMFIPSRTGRGDHRRTVCASNLGGIGRGIKVYANDYEDSYPIAYHKPMLAAAGQPPPETESPR